MDHATWQSTQDTVRVETDYHKFDVAYVEEGAGDPATVFLHGIPTWGFLFRDAYDAVNHAFVPDLAGWGWTEHIGPGEYDRSLAVQETLVVNLLDELGLETAQIVGHDTGGSIALRLAVHTDRVERLVLSNIGSYDSWPVQFVADISVPEGAGGGEWIPDRVEETFDKMLDLGTSEGRATEEFVTGMKAPFFDGPRADNDISRHASAYNVNHTTELTPFLDQIEAPTLLLWGAEDDFQPPKWADKLAEDIPDTRKEYLSARHWLMQDELTAYRSALEEFLE